MRNFRAITIVETGPQLLQEKLQVSESESILRIWKGKLLQISRHVCIPEEQKWLQECGEDFGQYLKIIFSAKESIFKAFFPYSRTYLHFHDARY